MSSSNEKELYLEDFEVGQTIEIGSYFLSKEALIEFATQWDPQYFHLDEEQAKESPMGVLCASGLQTLSICQRLLVTNFTHRCALVGGLGMEDLSLFQPVLPDETLTANITITHVRRVSRGDRGIVSYEQKAYNPRNECVMSVGAKAMVLCRHTES